MSRRARAVVVTISDSAYRGEREDLSGPAVCAALETLGCEIALATVVPDAIERIQAVLVESSQDGGIDLVITTGGTGLSPRDVTPEATAAILEREIPGLAEVMRWEGAKSTPRAVLSRATAGIRNKTLIINLPGSVRGATQSLAAMAPVLSHALEIISGKSVRCGD
jgi:molybdenum cofactor synthesis domain-containing protein